MRAKRRRVIFPVGHVPGSPRPRNPNQKPSQSLRYPQKLMADGSGGVVNINPAFSSLPLLTDPVSTSTSTAQAGTVQECLPLLRAALDTPPETSGLNDSGAPRLDREAHIEFLENALGQFPANFVGIESSRPWMVYWGLMGLYFLGEDTSSFANR